jgi:hypothetical protein
MFTLYRSSIVNLPAYDVWIIDCTVHLLLWYENNLILCSSNSALFWKIFKNFTSRENKRVITPERVRKGIISDLLYFMSDLQTIRFLKRTCKANVSRKVLYSINDKVVESVAGCCEDRSDRSGSMKSRNSLISWRNKCFSRRTSIRQVGLLVI